MDIMDTDIALKRAVMEDQQQYTQLCRICLITAERNFKNMTRAVYDTIPYFTIYFETVGRKMVPFGKFSPRICSMCEIEMLEAYKFRKKCLLADEKVTKLLEQLAPPPEPLDITGDEAVASSSRLQVKKEGEEVEENHLDQRNNVLFIKDEKKGRKKKRKFRCKVCRVIFAELEIFKVHKCMMCEPKIIKDKRAIYTTKKAKEKEKKKKKEEKEDDVNMKEATRKRNRNKQEYACNQCDKVCTNRQGFLLHMDKHNDVARYDCDQCDKKFRHWQSRRTHIYRVHLKKPFCACPHCGKTFYQIKYMKTHIQEYHSNFSGYQCEKCGKNFRSKAAFTDHHKSHSGEITCKICSKVLKTRKTYFRHLETHTGERNYICPVCSKPYTCNFTMKKHVRRTHPEQVHLLPPDGTIVNKRYLRKSGLEESVDPLLLNPPFEIPQNISDEIQNENVMM
ncbi:zinc finger protein 2 homolog [Sergentomyia squamirostris]